MDTPEPERKASRTAFGVAMIRAVHQTLDGQPKILDDPIAAALLGDEFDQQVTAYQDRAREPWIMELRSQVVLRSRFAEDRLADAVQRGARQCVILGAGFDTFAYRQPDWARALRIFEVDHHGTQEEKRRRLARAGIPQPANLEYVAIDFESTSLREGLQRSSLDFSTPTFFSCLGVLVYLTRDAVDAIFELVAGFPQGSEIAFTFSTPDRAVSDLADRVSSLGEPWQTHFNPEELIPHLAALGFQETSMLNTDEAERALFQGRGDGLHAPRRGGIAAAVVGPDLDRQKNSGAAIQTG
jgi:methyltransferase (TIGR00027 family)